MSFRVQEFLDKIGNVDKDYRLMALFDLMKSLKHGDRAAVHDVVVETLIQTLSDTDSQVRNEAVSVFPLLICSCECHQQNTLFTHLVNAAASQVSWFGSKDFSEHADLCAMALKRSTAALAEACQRSVEKWQTEIPVVAKLVSVAATQLQGAIKESGRENVYAGIVNLISLFGSTWEHDVKASIAGCAMKDFSQLPNICRLTGSCIAKLLPFTDEGTFTTVQKFSFDGLVQNDEKMFPAFLQLCGEEFASDSYRLRNCARKLVDILLAKLRAVVEFAEDPKADNELLTIDKLLNTYREQLEPTWSGIFEVCQAVATVGISTTAGAGDNETYAADDYYGEDYYGASMDETWKLRREALRIIATLAMLSDNEQFGAKALASAAQGICDTFEEVQLEAFPVIQTVARKPYATSPQIVNSLVDMCPALLYFLQFQGKTFVPALTCLELFFRPDNDASAFAPHVANGLEDALVASPKAPASRADLVRVTCRALESILDSASSSTHKYAKALSVSLLNTTTLETHPKAIQLCISAVELLIATHRLFPDAQIGAKTLAVCDEICGAAESDTVVRCASLKAASRWCSTSDEKPLVTQFLGVIQRGMSDESTCIAALKALAVGSASPLCVAEIQASNATKDAVEALSAPTAATRQAAFDAITVLLRAGLSLGSPLGEAALLASQKCVSEHMCPVLYMCSAFCERDPARADSIYERVVSQAWDAIPLHSHDEHTYMPTLEVRAVANVCASLSKASAAIRKTISERVVSCITQADSSALAGCALVQGVAVADDAFTSSLVSELEVKLSRNRGAWLLALGEASRVMSLHESLRAQLLYSVEEQAGERVRTCAEMALSLAMLNPANHALLQDCAKRAVSPDAKDALCYIRAMQTAARWAATMGTSCFHDAKTCVPLMETLLLLKAHESVTDAIGGCVGSMACLFPDEAAKLLIAVAESHRPSPSADDSSSAHILCASAARFILTSTENSKAQTSVKHVVELLSPFFTRDFDLPLRQALARLFTAVAHTYPEWLCCEEFKVALTGLIVDLIPCSKLVGRLVIGNYTHCTDRGLELRVQVFECISAIFDADERKGTSVLTFASQKDSLLNALIHECGSTVADGATSPLETDKTINDRAKRLVARFFRLFPDAEPTPAQINHLCGNLDVNLDVGSTGEVGTRDAATVQSINLIWSLKECPCFTHNAAFQKVVAKATRSPFLADAVALK